jgi:hypothetical protein
MTKGVLARESNIEVTKDKNVLGRAFLQTSSLKGSSGVL